MASPRDLPSVDQLLHRLRPFNGLPDELLKSEIRAVLSQKRQDLTQGKNVETGSLEKQISDRLRALSKFSLQRVINATGVVLHTNLGRAPLPVFTPIEGYSNLEYDLAAGHRGKRDDHLSSLLLSLLGKPAIAVNNNAAAVYLVLNELASGSEVIVSRGELIEIGDGFRIPDIMLRAGVILREVGTTNRTRIGDYRSAITEHTRLILRVHPSNFHLTGFTARPALEELVALGREHALPIYEDLGSGCLVSTHSTLPEPTVQTSLAHGANLVSFSCDKLLGGPQAGLIAGDPELVHRVRRNPMYRAFRVDKLILQSLQTTCHHYLRNDWRSIPVWRMILAPLEELKARAERVAANLAGFPCQICQAESVIGGGSTPDQTLPTWVIELTVSDVDRFTGGLRSASVPVIARAERGKVILDMRTVFDSEESLLADSVRAQTA